MTLLEVDRLYFNCHKTTMMNFGGLYLVSLKFLKTQKATKTPENEDDAYLKCTVTVRLNYEKLLKKWQI